MIREALHVPESFREPQAALNRRPSCLLLIDRTLRVLAYSDANDALYRALSTDSDVSANDGLRMLVARCAQNGGSSALLPDGRILRVTALRGEHDCYACTIEPLRTNRGRLENCSRRYGLSSRETEVLGLLVRGMNSAEISHTLGIAEPTVATYVRNIGAKTGRTRRSSLVALALEAD